MVSQFISALQATSLAHSVSESTWLFPTIETVHVLALVLVVGSIMVVDLRLLNLASRNRSVTELTAEVLPWTWSAFACAAVTGSLLFSSSATRYWGIWEFRAKLVMLVLAALNMAVFHLCIYGSVERWGRPSASPPPAARVAGALSLAIWLTVVTLGRWIGFV